MKNVERGEGDKGTKEKTEETETTFPSSLTGHSLVVTKQKNILRTIIDL
jgi:hypothetical protein